MKTCSHRLSVTTAVLISAQFLLSGAAVRAEGPNPSRMLINSSLPIQQENHLPVQEVLKAASIDKKAGDGQVSQPVESSLQNQEPVSGSVPKAKEAEPIVESSSWTTSETSDSSVKSIESSAKSANLSPDQSQSQTSEPLQKSDSSATNLLIEQKNEPKEQASSEFDYNNRDIATRLLVPPVQPKLQTTVQPDGSQIIIVDNDEAEETESTIEFENLPTNETKTAVKAGARFPVVVTSEITSKTAKKGDPLQARLKYDLKIGDRLIAKKGSVVTGHLNYVLPARTTLHTLVSRERWYRNSGVLGIAFDEIVTEKGEHLPLVAQPARKARIIKNKGEGRELGVNHNGQVTGPWAQQLRYKAVRVGLNAALAPAGVFSFGAMPVALGVMGAINPSFAFSKPVGLNVRHRRIKGFAWGFLSGIPGSWLIEDTVVKGQEAVIKPGDEFLAEFRDNFTGEAATDAQLMPGASTKVRGQVVSDTKTKGKKK